MAMLFEAAQSSGHDMDMIFMIQNLHFLRMGLLLNPSFNEKLTEDDTRISISGQVPSYLFGIVLGELFENVNFDCTCSDESEVFYLEDSLFSLISSEDYEKSMLKNKLELALNTFGEFICHDISINVNGMMLDDDLMDEFEDIQYETEDFIKLIKHMFTEKHFEFRIYYTEDLTLVLETLIELKSVLGEIEEEFNGKDHTIAA